MSPVPENRGSLKATIDALVAELATIHESLNVYRYWRPDMELPAVWLWLTPATTDAPDVCRVRDTARITVSIGVDPQAIAGEGDLLEIEVYADLAIDVLNAALYAPNPLGQRMARRRGFQTVADRLGDAPILTLELPIEVELDRSVQPSP